MAAESDKNTGDLVVSYPFDVNLEYLPPTSNISALLGAHGHRALIDDTEVDTKLPDIQVDYLSHDWKESDVWESWKAMTKHKTEMVDGLRLENASWRRWAQQRNSLRTVDPVSLNWLKDSDVTWLYGPLHRGEELPAFPPPRESTTQDRLGLDSVPASTPVSRARKDSAGGNHVPEGKRPQPQGILKHRTISDILGHSPIGVQQTRSQDSDKSSHSSLESGGDRKRPVLFADTKNLDNNDQQQQQQQQQDTPTRRHISFALPLEE